MSKEVYEEFNQPIYRQQLANGLTLQMMPMTGYHKTYASYTTDFGSIDNYFVPYGKQDPIKVPDGIAHFLEHKMFEKSDHDAFDLFGKLGADSNAFTSFTQTSYLFSTTSHVHESLDVLLDFVQEPYFTEQTVNKEQGIIGQEIKMYEDDASWRLYLGILGNLYPHDPMHIDIAGTVESISKITPEYLMETYKTFYQPSNMNLVLAGNLNPDEIVNWVTQNQNQRQFLPAIKPNRIFNLNDPTAHDVIPFRSLTMDVARPKVIVGLRGIEMPGDGRERLRYKLAIDLLLDVLFDDTSDNYLRLYNNEILDDSFAYNLEMQRDFYFAYFSSDTDQMERFADEVIAILESADQQIDAARTRFNEIKNAEIGRLTGLLDSPEAVANHYGGKFFDGANLMDEIRELRLINLDDLYDVAKRFIVSQGISVFQIIPQHR
ncbi:EF-P 5-aminopentanol modification-associated protein YfmH [Limosilactobacillus fastidiosus]|uniref:Insulinase family protein n=1 Tax=Limosilactobacillus fastidiosus TaxID=2759855 RepID=A0A7W3TYK8_9LACO|nr:pitrilysin family protein [Limosilactobacillus fastidiosus]MBB1063074.1 insulinase family protein [Limosilactobacillus fastidiosus]MBB1085673.1 insulinase family protein [Limosilactobacillus fastidiosus]MCD7083845.1 insulinase family protein [Limosilactobacillus fastidiosus]MCD7086152.1 insulinase family protein [Limosilactobacillus fastidiosus]MCD7114013.1 insulinase family protein [Limosilactobacillus fastidiosus]